MEVLTAKGFNVRWPWGPPLLDNMEPASLQRGPGEFTNIYYPVPSDRGSMLQGQEKEREHRRRIQCFSNTFRCGALC